MLFKSIFGQLSINLDYLRVHFKNFKLLWIFNFLFLTRYRKIIVIELTLIFFLSDCLFKISLLTLLSKLKHYNSVCVVQSLCSVFTHHLYYTSSRDLNALGLLFKWLHHLGVPYKPRPILLMLASLKVVVLIIQWNIHNISLKSYTFVNLILSCSTPIARSHRSICVLILVYE